MHTTQVPGRARDVLSQAEAAARAVRVRDVTYDLWLRLSAGADDYDGRVTVGFELLSGDDPVWLDHAGGRPTTTLDGVERELVVEGARIMLPADLAPGRHELRLGYRNRYDDTGDGFHHFVDPEDATEYVYSNFQPFEAHRLFPCFDQPDIKATYAVTVEAPAHWRVVSAMRARVDELPDGHLRHVFTTTPRFSTYLLAVVAGEWHAVHEERDGLSLGLYARRSMAAMVEREADELFEVTRQGFAFYSDLFDQAYPFEKYDQLFVPEFNAGAMENVGAVTFHDSFLFRDPPTEPERLTRAEVVLHELAHMWFGDLVTMRWWDDLWLNESFATFMSFLALDEATRFSAAWQQFNGTLKPLAYRDDQLITTHPIAGEVADTDEAELGFDGITYEKGASVLKQLVATIGRDAFRDGIRSYFRRHAWGNATLHDFLAALGDAAGRDLDEWARVWIRTASLNTIEARWTTEDDRITAFELHQGAPADHPTLRPHTMRVGVLHTSQGGDALTVQEATIEGPVADVPALVGLPTPDFVFPNHEDHDYAKVILDPVSLAFARARLDEVEDPFLRQLVWSSLWDMTRDARLRSTEYLAMVRRHAPAESDVALLDAVLDQAIVALRRYVPEERIAAEGAALVRVARETLASTDRPDDDRRLWLRLAIAAASDPADLTDVLALLDGAGDTGLPVDQEMRWEASVRALAFGLSDAEERIDRERDRDPSDRGQRAVIRAQVAPPDAAAKATAWERIHGTGYGSDYLTRAALAGFQWHHQRELLMPWREPFFEQVRAVYRERDLGFARAYLRALHPIGWGEPDVLERSRALLADLDADEVQLRRHLLDQCDDMERLIRVRAFAATTD
ncbi:MAG: aminopeptidase N [Chloroflexi bacterium]|nr:aminopeptidase N [Chloroflexota bacterium]